MPNINDLDVFINNVWQGSTKYNVDPSSWYFKSRLPFQGKTYHNLDKIGKPTNLLEQMRNTYDPARKGGC